MANMVTIEATWPTRFCISGTIPGFSGSNYLFIFTHTSTSRAKGANTNIYEMCLLFLSLQ